MTIVSLTFDDALDCHLDTAVPLLERHGLPGTFYINLGSDTLARRHRDWQGVAARGHELGNHTLFHPGVAAKPWVSEGIALEGYTLDRIARELTLANTFLRILDGRDERTFAFPCSNPWLGEASWAQRLLVRAGLDRTRLVGWVDRLGLDFGSSRLDYTPAVAERFFAARCGGIAPEQLPAVPPRRFQIRGVEGDGMDIAGLLAVVDLAVNRNAWLVLVFHGIGGGHHLSCDREVFTELLAALATDHRVEVLTFLDGAKRIWGSRWPR